jgi:hypothetical protein
MMNHLKEHIALWYAASVFELGNETAGEDIGELLKQNKTPDDKRAFDRMLAEASQIVSKEATGVFQALPPIIQQAQQIMQQLAPQPVDPAAQAAMAEIQQRTQAAQQRAQIDAQKLQVQAQESQTQAQIDAQKLQLDAAKLQQEAQADAANEAGEDKRKAAELMARQQMNTQDNMTAMQIANLEAVTGERVGVSTGTGINP